MADYNLIATLELTPAQGIQALVDKVYLYNPDAINKLIIQINELIRDLESLSGWYKDLKGLPYLNTLSEESLEPTREVILDEVYLHKVSKTGDYFDLVNTPDWQGKLDEEKAQREAADAAEATARAEADNVLQSNIDSEASAREAAVTAEQEARIAADANLQEQVDTLRNDEAALGQQVAVIESKIPQNATSANQMTTAADLAAETAQRQAQDTALSNRITANANAITKTNQDFAAADATLQGNIDKVADDLETLSGEVAKNASDIVTINNDISELGNELTDTNNALSAETAARIAADSKHTADITANTNAINAHVADQTNPHKVTKAQVGLGNADNTSDINKPVSTAQANAISSAIAQEVADRNTAIDGAIATEVANRNTAIEEAVAAEAAIREQVDNTLATKDTVNALTGRVTTIEGKIPSAASTSNQLADKAFVNSSINNMAAFYITSNAAGDAFATKSALDAGPWYYQGASRTPTSNDYAIVISDETKNNASSRYLFDGAQWDFQYIVNDTPFTQEQLNALNSGINESLVTQYSEHVANTSNPHSVTKTQVGLGNVDNTSDVNKPVSTAQAAAIATKADKATTLAGYNIGDAYTKAQVDAIAADKVSKSTTEAQEVAGPLNVTDTLGVSNAEGQFQVGIVAGVATISTNNGMDIVSKTKFDTSPTTDDTTNYANANATSLVRKAQVVEAIAGVTATTDAITTRVDGIEDRVDVAESDIGSLEGDMSTAKTDISNIKTSINGQAEVIQQLVDGKQNKLTAGDNINISGNTISAIVPEELPDQTSNEGKYLRTDGVNATWERVEELHGLRGDYASQYGIVNYTGNTIAEINIDTGNIGVMAGVQLKVPGNGGLIQIASSDSHEVVSTTDFTLFYADGDYLEADAYYQTEEPADNGGERFQAWWNGSVWQFRSNDTGNVWRATDNCTPILDAHFSGSSLVRLDFAPYTLLEADVVATRAYAEGLADGAEQAAKTYTDGEISAEAQAREAADSTLETTKQDVLTAGNNISIVNNVISSTAPAAAPVGSIIAFAGNSTPAGYLLCDGSTLSTTTYAALYAVIGNTYGGSQSSGTFALPNQRQASGSTIGLPDWPSATSITTTTVQTAEEPLWISWAAFNTTQGTLYINGNPFGSAAGIVNLWADADGVVVPINAGDTYRATGWSYYRKAKMIWPENTYYIKY